MCCYAVAARGAVTSEIAFDVDDQFHSHPTHNRLLRVRVPWYDPRVTNNKWAVF